MLSDIFHFLVYDPLYNGLVFFINHVPYADVGLAIVLITAAVKLILFPISLKATRTQFKVKQLEPELNKLKEEYKNDRQQQAQKMMELYKQHQVNPFAGIVVIFIQIPILLALHFIFLSGGLPEIDTTLLYSFVQVPERVNMEFLGLVDMAARSIPLALLAGVTQYIQTQLSLPAMKERSKNPGLKEDLARSFQLQMRYVLPIIVVFIAYFISSAVALYWATSNLFAIGQELYVRKRIKPALTEDNTEQTQKDAESR